jgi:hypothetical protein
MLSIRDINSAIIAGTFTNDQLSSIVDAVRFARSQLTQQTKRSLTLGDTVKFTSNKNGMTYAGTVDKIAIKFVTVRTAQGLWKVPANMLVAA